MQLALADSDFEFRVLQGGCSLPKIYICYVFDSFFLLFSICIANLIVVQKNKYTYSFFFVRHAFTPHTRGRVQSVLNLRIKSHSCHVSP